MAFDFSVFDGRRGEHGISIQDLLRLPILELEGIKPFLIEKSKNENLFVNIVKVGDVMKFEWYPKEEGH